MNEADKYLAARALAKQINIASSINPCNQTTMASKRKSWFLFGLILLSGIFGICAALLRQLTIGLPEILASIIVAPPVEEILKVAIPIMVLEHRTTWFRRGQNLLWFALGSALVFGVMENLLYTFVYLSSPSANVLLWRWVGCTTLHIVASGLSGVGLMRAYNRGRRDNQPPRFIWEWPWLVGAMAVHMVYNTFVVFFVEPL